MFECKIYIYRWCLGLACDVKHCPVSYFSFIHRLWRYVRRRRFVSLRVKYQNSLTSRLQIPHTTDPQYFIIYKNLRDVWIPTLALQGRAAWPGSCCRHWLCSAASRARRLSVCRGRGGHWTVRPEHWARPSDCDLAVCREGSRHSHAAGHSADSVKVSSRLLIPSPWLCIDTWCPLIVDWRQHKVRLAPTGCELWLQQAPPRQSLILMTTVWPGLGWAASQRCHYTEMCLLQYLLCSIIICCMAMSSVSLCNNMLSRGEKCVAVCSAGRHSDDLLSSDSDKGQKEHSYFEETSKAEPALMISVRSRNIISVWEYYIYQNPEWLTLTEKILNSWLCTLCTYTCTITRKIIWTCLPFWGTNSLLSVFKLYCFNFEVLSHRHIWSWLVFCWNLLS